MSLCKCKRCHGTPIIRRLEAFTATAGEEVGEYVGVYNECYCPYCKQSSGLWEFVYDAECMWNELNYVE